MGSTIYCIGVDSDTEH